MKKLITILLLVCLGGNYNAIANPSNLRDSLATYAETLKGVPYHYGGTSENGFDCSGFVYLVFKNFNQSVPHTSKSYSNFGTDVSTENCQIGEVIVFAGTNSSIRKRGRIVTRYNETGYVKKFLSIVNVINE